MNPAFLTALLAAGAYGVSKLNQAAAWIADKIIPTSLGATPVGGELFVTVHPRQSYGPPVPPSYTAPKNITVWHMWALAGIILSVGYFAKNTKSFFR